LKGTRAALLKERTESSKTLVQHGPGSKKDRIRANQGQRIRKIRVVQKVESVCAELDVHTVADRKLPGQGQVNLRKPESSDIVPAFGTLNASRGN
jgi:hypothetical protein